ncbi:GH22565 [Drosophila grimshawi]|uniref:GH22565 n=1 Tax=Drosophila grimshawi TaxID=7222 RepID=B4K3F4_DROGR|nr:GH22565 [Drosophila grimshawi]
MRHFSQLSNKLNQHHRTNQAQAESVGAASAPTHATTNNTVPHLTISFMAPNSQMATQQQQPQPLLSAAPAIGPNNNWSSCSNMPAADNYQQIPATSHYCQYANFPQPQVQQQQYLGSPAAYGNCCSSCCLLRPTSTQISLGYCHPPGVASYCSHHLQQPTQLYPTARLPQQRINNCYYYPVQCHCQRYKAFYDNQQQQQQLLHDQCIFPADRISMDSPLASLSLPKQVEKSEEKSTFRAKTFDPQEATFLTKHKQPEYPNNLPQ